MLLNTLFTIEKIKFSEYKDLLNTEIILNENHPIFSGHFPNQPVLPGVCTLEILKETLSQALNMNLILKQADTIKFQLPIIPTETPRLELNIKLSYNEHITVNARFSANEKIYCSFKGIFLKT